MTFGNILIISVSILCEIFSYLILIRCFISFLPISKGNIFTNAIYNLTEPLLAPARNLLNLVFRRHMMLDFSPIVAFMLIDYVLKPALISFIQFIFR